MAKDNYSGNCQLHQVEFTEIRIFRIHAEIVFLHFFKSLLYPSKRYFFNDSSLSTLYSMCDDYLMIVSLGVLQNDHKQAFLWEISFDGFNV
jgi:hypothetical protein